MPSVAFVVPSARCQTKVPEGDGIENRRRSKPCAQQQRASAKVAQRPFTVGAVKARLCGNVRWNYKVSLNGVQLLMVRAPRISRHDRCSEKAQAKCRGRSEHKPTSADRVYRSVGQHAGRVEEQAVTPVVCMILTADLRMSL